MRRSALILATTLAACKSDPIAPPPLQPITCEDGYVDYQGTCVDDDECRLANSCDAHATCINVPGSYRCECREGYSGDGKTCTDIDECATNNGGCDPLTQCYEGEGGRTCGECPFGYYGDGTTGCLEANECSSNNVRCAAEESCADQVMDYLCVFVCPSPRQHAFSNTAIAVLPPIEWPSIETIELTHDEQRIEGTFAQVGRTFVFTPKAPLAEGSHRATAFAPDGRNT